MTPRIPLPTDEQLGPELLAVLSQAPPVNVFRMVAHAPSCLVPLMGMVRALVLEGSLDPRIRELAILRVARVTGSSYEWTQHVVLAGQVGCTDDDIAAVGVDGPVTGMGELERLVCRVVDEICVDVRLSDEGLEALTEAMSAAHATELIVCIGFYSGLSRILESTRVPLEGSDVLRDASPLRKDEVR